MTAFRSILIAVALLMTTVAWMPTAAADCIPREVRGQCVGVWRLGPYTCYGIHDGQCTGVWYTQTHDTMCALNWCLRGTVEDFIVPDCGYKLPARTCIPLIDDMKLT